MSGIDKRDFIIMHVDDNDKAVYIRATEGTGDNLLQEDIDLGYVDYVNYTIYGTLKEAVIDDGENEIDGGMVLCSQLVADMYFDDILTNVLEMTGFTDTENIECISIEEAERRTNHEPAPAHKVRYEFFGYDKDHDVSESLMTVITDGNVADIASLLDKSIKNEERVSKSGEPFDWLQVSIDFSEPVYYMDTPISGKEPDDYEQDGR